MTDYDFDIPVDRSGMASIKEGKTTEQMRKAGLRSFWGAEFEFKTAPCVIRAGREWAERGLAAYCTADDSYRELVCGWMRMHRGWEIQKEWIVPTYGMTCSVGTLVRAFTQPGDGVIGMDPVYHMTWEPVRLNGRRKVSCPLLFDGETYSIDYHRLEELCADPRNRVLYVCNPHNPIAKVWGREDLQRIAEIAGAHQVLIYSDEIFGDTVYEGVEMLSFSQVTDYDGWIAATSIGKTFSVTGIGQANLIIRNEEIRQRFITQRNRDHYGSFDPYMRAIYFGGYTKEGSEWVRAMMAYCYQNYLLVDSYLRERIPQMRVIRPEGSYVLWIDCRGLGLSGEEEYERFLEEAMFGCDSGVQYGSEPGFIRMTIAVPAGLVQAGLEALERAVRSL